MLRSLIGLHMEFGLPANFFPPLDVGGGRRLMGPSLLDHDLVVLGFPLPPEELLIPRAFLPDFLESSPPVSLLSLCHQMEGLSPIFFFPLGSIGAWLFLLFVAVSLSSTSYSFFQALDQWILSPARGPQTITFALFFLEK